MVGFPGDEGTLIGAGLGEASLGEVTDRGDGAGAGFEEISGLDKGAGLDEGVNLGDARGFGERLGLSWFCSALSRNLER